MSRARFRAGPVTSVEPIRHGPTPASGGSDEVGSVAGTTGQLSVPAKAVVADHPDPGIRRVDPAQIGTGVGRLR